MLGGGWLPLNIFLGFIFFRVGLRYFQGGEGEKLSRGWEIFVEGWEIFGGGLRNFRGGGVEKFSGGGLRNFRGGWEIFWWGGWEIFGGGDEKFSGERVEVFLGGGGWYWEISEGLILFWEGLHFFVRGDIFSGGVGNFLGAGLRFFGCGNWELFGRPGWHFFGRGWHFFGRGWHFFGRGWDFFGRVEIILGRGWDFFRGGGREVEKFSRCVWNFQGG